MPGGAGWVIARDRRSGPATGLKARWSTVSLLAGLWLVGRWLCLGWLLGSAAELIAALPMVL